MSCQVWEFIEDDVYCSWCGATLIDIRLSIQPPHVYLGDYDTKLTLTIEHSGAIGTVELERVEARHPWIKVQGKPITGVKLQSGMHAEVELEIDTRGLTDDYHEGRVAVFSSLGVHEIKLDAVPWPAPQATLDEFTVILDRIAEEHMAGYLSLPRGIVTVEELTTDVPWASVELSNKISLPHKLDARSNIPLEFKLKVNEPYLLDHIERSKETPPVTFVGNLVVRYAELTPERKHIFYVKGFHPPMLDFQLETNRVKIEVFTGKRGEIDLTLLNGEEKGEAGRADLQIHEIKINKTWLKPTVPFSFPIIITSGNYLQLTFTALADEIGEGSNIAKIVFFTNIAGEDRLKEFFVDVDVQQMSDFEGTLAIDFGTTNSCCAFIDARNRHGLIPIDDSSTANPTTASSTILYENIFEDNEKQYIIGAGAYEFSFDSSAKFSAVRQVKRRLGTTEPYKIIFHADSSKSTSYLPVEVAADILKRIFERAEEKLKGRISSCTITHPSRFSLRQIEDLKAALSSCGITPEKIKLVHESIGAALEFIQDREVLEKYDQYYLLVYDFGGGTTDITLLHVVNSQSTTQNIKVITPKVIGATGDPLLGGEDVTDLVMKLLHKNCEEALSDRYPNAANAIIPFDVENFQAPRRQTFARQNRNFFRRIAEATKIAISTFGDAHADKLLTAEAMVVDGENLKLRLPRELQPTVILDNEVKHDVKFIYRDIVPKEAAIDDQLRPRLEAFISLLKEWAVNCGVASPDVTLLSGKSSALPIVAEVIKKHFPKTEVARAHELKECVVRGACRLSSRLPRAGVRIDLEENVTLSATTSRLGIAVDDGSAEHGVFKEIIGAGVPIGADGIKRPLTDISLDYRDTQFRILENTGVATALYINGEENKHIKELKAFNLESKLAEWERRHNKHINEKALREAEIMLEMMPNLSIKLVARIPGVDEPLEFEAEWV
ncbi:MAG TPA: Hsp70 family protein [Pyrinomonadaceae bacterium]|jgi:molecular chaperone DnaK (HSP70)